MVLIAVPLRSLQDDENYDDYVKELHVAAFALIVQQPTAIVMLLNAMDPDLAQGQRTRQRLDGIGQMWDIIHFPAFGMMQHKSNGFCPQSPTKINSCRKSLEQFSSVLLQLRNENRIRIVGKYAAQAVSYLQLDPSHFIVHFTFWMLPEVMKETHVSLSQVMTEFWDFSTFEQWLSTTQTTSNMIAAARKTIEWVKHLPASANQKAAASRTGSRTIHAIKHLPATAKTKAAAAQNGKTANSRAAAKKNGKEFGVKNFMDAKARPDFRQEYLRTIRQVTPESVAFALQELIRENPDSCLLDLAHSLSKQEGHTKKFIHDAVRDGKILSEDADRFLKVKKPDESIRRKRVNAEQAKRLYNSAEGFSEHRIAYLNDTPVTPGDILNSIGLTSKQYRDAQKSRPPHPTEEGIKIVALEFLNISSERLAVICTAPGKSVQNTLRTIEQHRRS
jgi:hypothetical protein